MTKSAIQKKPKIKKGIIAINNKKTKMRYIYKQDFLNEKRR